MEEREDLYADRANWLWKKYQDGLTYQNTTEMSTEFPRYVDYYEGEQWAKDNNESNIPQMTINIIKMICDIKRANIRSIPCKWTFKSESKDDIAQKVTRYAEYWKKKVKFEDLDDNAVSDGGVVGSYFYHFYWDNEKNMTKVELIDALKIFVENPLEEDVNKQKWVMVASRESVDTVRGMADEGVSREDIISDKAQANPYQEVEAEDNDLCTLLTRYFKQDGEVWCERSIQNLVINEAFPLTPIVEGEETTDRAELYPIVRGAYYRKRNCFWGGGEVVNLIENQVQINKITSMQAHNIMTNAWGRYIVDENALEDGEEITNEAGSFIVDHSKTGNGIRRMPEAVMSGIPAQVLEQIISLVRVVSGANEVVSGDYIKAGMSGAAIAQLQAQASLPTENLMYRHWRVLEQCGLVWLQFERLYNTGTIAFTYEEKTDDGTQMMSDTIELEDLVQTDLDLVCEAGGGTRSSTAGDINFLESMLRLQAITPLDFARAYPSSALSDKDKIVKILEDREKSEMVALQSKVQQYEQQMAQSSQIIERLNKVVNDIVPTIQENNALKVKLAELQKEYTDKLNIAQSDLDTVSQDAQEFAMELNKYTNGNNTQEIAKKSKI